MPPNRQTERETTFSFSLGELLAIVFVAGYLLAFLRIGLPHATGSNGEQVRRLEVLTLLTVPDALIDTLGQERASGWFSERAYLLAMSIGYLVVSAALGSVLLRWIRPQVSHSRVEQWVFALALGLAGLSLVTFLLGVFGLLFQWLFLAIAVGTGVAFAIARPAKTTETPATPPTEASVGISRAWLWMLAPVVALLLLGSMLPPRDFDVLEYHLQAPKEFFQNGRIGFLPHNIYANMPLGAEMHALAAMVVTQDWYAGAIVGKTVMACFALITAAAIYAFCCRFFSPTAGIVGAIAYLTTPWVLMVSAEGLNDGVVGCYTLLTIYALAIWQERVRELESGSEGSTQGERQSPSRPLAHSPTRPLVLAGLLAGAAVSCKYTAVVFVALPAVVFVAWSNVVHRDYRSRLYGVMVLLAAMAIPSGPWFLKNWVLTGNPTYPLMYSVFGGTTRTPEKDAQWRRAHVPPNYSPQDFGQRLHHSLLKSDWLGLAIMPLAALGLTGAALRRNRDRQNQAALLTLELAGYCVLYFALWWMLTHRIDRFLIPLLPIVALLAGSACGAGLTKLQKFAVPGLLLLASCYAASIALFAFEMARLPSIFAKPDPWHRLPYPPAEGDRLLLVGGAAVFDQRIPVLYNTCFDDCILEQLIKGKDPAAAKAALHAAGVTHIGVDWSELARYRSPGNYGYSRFPTKELFDQLVKEGVLKPQPGYYPSPYTFEGFKVVD